MPSLTFRTGQVPTAFSEYRSLLRVLSSVVVDVCLAGGYFASYNPESLLAQDDQSTELPEIIGQVPATERLFRLSKSFVRGDTVSGVKIASSNAS